MRSNRAPIKWYHLAPTAVAFLVGVFVWIPSTVDSQGSGVPIRGYLWSDTIGWIEVSCLNRGVCGSNSFGLAINGSGLITGYAWSDNIGWISANQADVSGCGSNPTITGGLVTGFLKAISGGTGQSGSWDGCIALSDQDTGDGVNYGVTYAGGFFGECDDTHANCAWGDANVGWVSFQYASTTFGTCTPSTVYSCADTQTIVETVTEASCEVIIADPYGTCVAPQFCSAGLSTCYIPQPEGIPGSGDLTGTLTAKPNLVPRSGTSTVYWDMSNVTDCSVSSTNGSAWTGNTSATSSCPTKFGTGCTSLPITEQTIFTLTCTDFNSQPHVQTAVVNLVPGFEENCSPGFVHENGQCVPL